jgi:hypothetical protein
MHQEIDNNNRVIAYRWDNSFLFHEISYYAVKFGGQKGGKFQRAIPLPVSDMKGRISIYDKYGDIIS